MFGKYLLPALAVIGFSLGVWSVVKGNQPTPVMPPVAEPAQAPFRHYIAGAGIVESASRNIEIGTPLAGIVHQVAVSVGDHVVKGTPLFSLDDREPQAELNLRRADLQKSKAAVAEAEAGVKDAQTLYNLAQSVSDPRAVSQEEIDRRRNALLIAKAKLESARAGVQQAEAAIAAVQTTLQRLVVRAPIDGEILQVNIRAGEFAPAGKLAVPLLSMGRIDALHVRVDIDENDAWRFDKNGKAVAYLRGNRDFRTDLTLAYVEPYVVPKRSLTGDTTERVDTRVLQALYRFEPGQLNAYVGQQMDVYIEIAPADHKDSGNADRQPL